MIYVAIVALILSHLGMYVRLGVLTREVEALHNKNTVVETGWAIVFKEKGKLKREFRVGDMSEGELVGHLVTEGLAHKVVSMTKVG